MGYGITAYRVNLDRLQTRFGVKDSKKRNTMLKACYGRRNSIDELGDESSPRFIDYANDLLNGTVSYPGNGFKYWYAIECFIGELGHLLNNNAWYPSPCDILFDFNEIKLYDIGRPLRIPGSDDFPTVFVLRKENMTDEFIRSFEEKHNDADQVYAMKNWIDQAKRYKQDLVMYYY
jgi:hypothetical protein